jgi:hypothetical protein
VPARLVALPVVNALLAPSLSADREALWRWREGATTMKVIANKSTGVFDKPGAARVGDMSVNERATATGKTEGGFTEIDFEDGSPVV